MYSMMDKSKDLPENAFNIGRKYLEDSDTMDLTFFISS